MIKEADILKLRLHAAAKFIGRRISITATRGSTVSLSENEVSELLSILNPREPFAFSENSFVEPGAEKKRNKKDLES